MTSNNIKKLRSGDYASFVLAVTLVFCLMFNIPYYASIFDGIGLITWAVALSLLECLIFFYIIALNRIVFIILGAITFFLVACFSYYMLVYDVTLSVWLIRVIVVADPREFSGFLDIKAILWCTLSMVVFAFFARLRFKTHKTTAIKTVIHILILALTVVGARAAEPRQMKRNVPMPYVYFEHIYHYGLEEYKIRHFLKNKHQITDDAEFSINTTDDLTVVLMIGESMRGDHLSINGYGKPTTPNIADSGAFSFAKAFSCMTLTSHSITCMFTRATAQTWDRSLKETSFISIFNLLGFSTNWISNQGRIGHDTWVGSIASEAQFVSFCEDGKSVNDTCMLPALDEVLSEQGRPKLIIMHLYGSHLRYDERYGKEFEVFTPVCDKTLAFAECNGEKLNNAYDNSILATDSFYKDVTDKLKDKNALLFFISDHGEPLGENGIRTRGDNNVPASRDIPFIVWMSDRFKAEHPVIVDTIAGNLSKAVSHDNLIYSILDCTGVKSTFIDQNYSICNPDLAPYPDPFAK